MTNEQKAAVERAADNINETLSVYASYYGHIMAGMTYVIDNPSDFGLMPILDSMDHIEESDQNWIEVVNDLKSQLTKYMGALERIVDQYEDFDPSPYKEAVMYKIAKEALKQEDTK